MTPCGSSIFLHGTGNTKKYANEITHMMCNRRVSSKPEGLCQSMVAEFRKFFMVPLHVVHPAEENYPNVVPSFSRCWAQCQYFFLAICQSKTFAVGVRFSCSIHVWVVKKLIVFMLIRCI